MKNGGKNKSVAFIILFSIYNIWVSLSEMSDKIDLFHDIHFFFLHVPVSEQLHS